MQPVNLDGLAQYLGPGTGGLFMGEQQRNAMQESEINQQKGLEDILNQRQTRDIQKQKLPFELQQAEQNVLKTKGEVAAQGTAAQDRLDKLDKQNVSDFMGAVLQYQSVDNPLDNAFQLQALAQKYKLDGNDPRIRSIMMNSMDKNGIRKMQQALIESDPKWQADRKKAEEEKAKSDADNTSRERQAHITGGYSVQRAQIQAAAKAAAAVRTKSIEELSKGDPIQFRVLLLQEAEKLAQQGKVDEANALFERANEPGLMNAYNNAIQRKAGVTFNPATGQMEQTGVTTPAPLAQPRGGGGSSFPPAPGTPAPATPPTAQPQTPNAPVKITSDAEYAALPRGTVYISPDGKQRTKQ